MSSLILSFNASSTKKTKARPASSLLFHSGQKTERPKETPFPGDRGRHTMGAALEVAEQNLPEQNL